MTVIGFLPRRFSVVLLGLAILTGGVGCGDSSGLPRRYAVRGTVTYKGEPVESGTITFHPLSADGRAATGFIEDGAYSLETVSGTNDGALPGEYAVTITSRRVDENVAAKGAEEGGGGAFYQDDVMKAYEEAENLIPTKYSLQTTSGLTATVEEQRNTFDFDLTD